MTTEINADQKAAMRDHGYKAAETRRVNRKARVAAI
jgi:hypothetical protein